MSNPKTVKRVAGEFLRKIQNRNAKGFGYQLSKGYSNPICQRSLDMLEVEKKVRAKKTKKGAVEYWVVKKTK